MIPCLYTKYLIWSVAYSHRTLATILWESFYSCHNQAWHKCTVQSHTVLKSWTYPSHGYGYSPLVALVKFVQWNWSQTHGEDMYVVTFGGLHIDISMWNTCGDFLEVSGWTTALIKSGTASFGTADSFLNVSHLSRTKTSPQSVCSCFGCPAAGCLLENSA